VYRIKSLRPKRSTAVAPGGSLGFRNRTLTLSGPSRGHRPPKLLSAPQADWPRRGGPRSPVPVLARRDAWSRGPRQPSFEGNGAAAPLWKSIKWYSGKSERLSALCEPASLLWRLLQKIQSRGTPFGVKVTAQ